MQRVHSPRGFVLDEVAPARLHGLKNRPLLWHLDKTDKRGWGHRFFLFYPKTKWSSQKNNLVSIILITFHEKRAQRKQKKINIFTIKFL